MNRYKVVEKFVSINGEATRAGELAVFIRFAGCNLNCSYCDTTWANEENCQYELLGAEDIVNYVRETGINNVTLTGGEPLLRDGMEILLEKLAAIPGISIEIETNGSIDISRYFDIADNITFTVDYKLPFSRMEEHMCMENYSNLRRCDTVKLVAASVEDLEKAKLIIEKYNLKGRTNIYISPVFGQIEPADIVDYMINNKMNSVKLQLQMHKFIWEPDRKGV